VQCVQRRGSSLRFGVLYQEDWSFVCVSHDSACILPSEKIVASLTDPTRNRFECFSCVVASRSHDEEILQKNGRGERNKNDASNFSNLSVNRVNTVLSFPQKSEDLFQIDSETRFETTVHVNMVD